MSSQKRKHSRSILPVILITLLLLSALGYGGWRWYDNNVDRSGWSRKNDIVRYLDFHGKPLNGWQEIDGERYFFHEETGMLTGWQKLDGKQMYFCPDGKLASGWQEINGRRYYLDAEGCPLSGWQELDGESYYLEADGAVHTGWLTEDGHRKYFDENGCMVKGWLDQGEDRYYLAEDGNALTGNQNLDGNDYYFYTDGAMHRGWIDAENGRNYFDSNGIKVTGWQEIDGKRFFFDETGGMYTGWKTEGEYRYYFQEDGSAATSPTEIDGTLCHFTPDGKYVLLVNYQYPVPENYQVELVGVGPWARVAKIAEQPLRQFISDCEATGVDVWLNCGFRSFKEQTEIMKERTEEHMEKDGLPESLAYQKALETVAVPGYSEHQIGLAMDIVCSEETSWLIDHCWEYGFILRYPPEKMDITHIAYEHWHFRYVGVEIAMAMKDTGLCLEEYLGAA